MRVTSFAPKSSVVMIGSRMELNCSVNENDSRAWTYTSWNSSTERSIYLGENIVASMRSRYRIDKTTSGKHNLIIDSVDLTHAGRYRCISIMQQSLMNDIQLTVLGRPDYKLAILHVHADLCALANSLRHYLFKI